MKKVILGAKQSFWGIGIVAIFLVGFSEIGFANSSWNELPDGICAKYAAQEFEKIAPPPGVNWLSENNYWVLRAHEGGWVVNTNVRDAMVGAIVEWNEVKKGAGGHVAIVREVLSDRIIVEEENVGKLIGERQCTFAGKKFTSEVTDGWGKTTTRAITYDKLLMFNDRKFAGYIWPIRQADYDKDPAKYQISIVAQLEKKEPTYKGFREFWSCAYMLKEFDKIAPMPGVNWTGKVGDWVNNAEKAGWVVKKNPIEAMVGALVVKENAEKHLIKVGIIRIINDNAITIDTRSSDLYPLTQTVALSDLNQDKGNFKFVGYIWPIRKN